MALVTMFQAGTDIALTTTTSEVPSSPTAALWLTEEKCYTKKTHQLIRTEDEESRKKTKKTVSFSREAKTHDGLSTRNSLLDSIVAAYFVDQKEISELDVLRLTNHSLKTTEELHEDLLLMVERMLAAVEIGKECSPVLPCGGGLCTKLLTAHLPYVQVLDKVVEAAAKRLRRAYIDLSKPSNINL